MSKRMRCHILSSLVCTLVFVSAAAAHEVSIRDRAKVGNGSELQPGTYRVEVVKNQDSSEVLFYKGKDLWLRAPVTLTNEARKCNNTEIHSQKVDGGTVITKIWLQGSRESLVFDRGTAEAE